MLTEEAEPRRCSVLPGDDGSSELSGSTICQVRLGAEKKR